MNFYKNSELLMNQFVYYFSAALLNPQFRKFYHSKQFIGTLYAPFNVEEKKAYKALSAKKRTSNL